MQEYIKASEAVSLFCRISMNAKRDLPIRASEMGMLIFIVKTQEPQTPIQIAAFFKVTKPMVTTMINSLMKKGYLTKQSSDIDKRSFTLIPTDKAKRLVDETYTEYFKSMALLKSNMGQEKFDKLIELLEQANTILAEEKANG